MIRAGSDFLITVAWQFLPGMVSTWKNRSVSPVGSPTAVSFQRSRATACKIKAAVHPVFEHKNVQYLQSQPNNLVAKFS